MHWTLDYHFKWVTATGENLETSYAMHSIRSDNMMIDVG